MPIAWTPDMDARLLKLRADRVPWKAILFEGATRKEVQDRHRWLTSDRPRAPVRVAKPGPRVDEDGLARLVRKGRLAGTRRAAAEFYREQGRLADQAGGGVKSCLDVGVGGGGVADRPGDLPLAIAVDAKRQLFQMRFVVLGGQTDLLTVMDGVCIRGFTTAALAGDDRHRARELEGLLLVACDLIGAWRTGPRLAEVA